MHVTCFKTEREKYRKMGKKRYLILGGGPTGLTIANMLKMKGNNNFLVLEKESEAGGLCRSMNVDGTALDIGGGHFLDVRRPEVDDFLFQFMPREEWNLFERNSKIDVDGERISYPIEANIWQMDIERQVKYLKSIANAGCNRGGGVKKPENFVEWIYWKLGDKIANDYMLPYNQKMFGENLNNLGTYWLEKLPNVSFEETLLSCLTHKAYGTQPGHTEFLYPKKYGYGELWLRMAESIKDNIEYDKRVKGIDFENRRVTTIDGVQYQADIIFTTIPWLEFSEINGMPDDIRKSIISLKYSSIQIEYISQNLSTDAHWIYCPNYLLPYHRILVRHNFCTNSKGYWTETNLERVVQDERSDNFKHLNQYAYPLNTINKPTIMKKLLRWSKSKNVIGIGRWGEHQHYNSDVTVQLALKLCDELQ